MNASSASLESEEKRMDQGIKLSIVLPVFALLLSVTAFLVPAYQGYQALRAAPMRGSMIVLGTGTNTFELPRNRAAQTACFMAALSTEGKIVALNMPAHFVQLLISLSLGKSVHWFPESLGPALWRVVGFPIFAAPAWCFVGNGLDNLVRMKRARNTSLVTSIVLGVLFAALALMLRFGLTESERNEQEMLSYYIFGLALWSFLFAVPAFARVRRKVKLSSGRATSSTGLE